MFAGSILGGLKSIYGAVVGGLVVGGSEILITTLRRAVPRAVGHAL